MSKTIADYNAANSIDASNDYLLIEPSGNTVYKKINRNVLLGLASAPLGTTDIQSPTNKTFDNTNTVTLKDTLFTLQDDGDVTKQARFQLSGITTGTTRTYTLPNASVTLASLTGTESLTNKTITSPTITGGTYDNGTITVDSISGHTVATTVTVANLQIANGVLNTANSVTATSIAAGAVQPQALVSGTGSGWASSTWTPTWQNLNIGNATTVYKYIQIGKIVFFRISVTFGSTSTMGTAPTFTLPVTAASLAGLEPIVGTFTDGGVNDYFTFITLNSTTVAAIRAVVSATITSTPTSTFPFTWGVGGSLSIKGFYEAA